MADDDQRDERLGRLLEVEPLDDVSRRRLVSAAMRSSAPSGRRGSTAHARRRLAMAAAAVVVVAVAAVGAFALRGGDSNAPTASAVRPDVTAPTSDGSATASPTTGAESSAPATTPSGATPRGLGDVGDLQIAANLDRLRSETTGAANAFSTPAAAAPSGDTASLVAQLRALPCAAELPLGTVVAIGTGHFGPRAAIVVAIALADGTTSLDAVITDACEVRPLD